MPEASSVPFFSAEAQEEHVVATRSARRGGTALPYRRGFPERQEPQGSGATQPGGGLS